MSCLAWSSGQWIGGCKASEKRRVVRSAFLLFETFVYKLTKVEFGLPGEQFGEAGKWQGYTMRANSEIGRQIDGAVVDGRHLTNAAMQTKRRCTELGDDGRGVTKYRDYNDGRMLVKTKGGAPLRQG